MKSLMTLNNITGLEMAKVLGLSQTSFYQKINGKREFTSGEIGQIAKELRTTPNFFYDICYDISNKIEENERE